MLKQLFTSDDNASVLMKLSLKKIKEAGLTNFKNDKDFFNIFNQIASTVFNHENDNLKKIKIENALSILNNIVVDEVTRYVLSKKRQQLPSHLPREDLKQDLQLPREELKQEQSVQSVTLNIKDEKFKMLVECEDFKLNYKIENITNIKIIELFMYNEDYIINENNNKLVLSQTYNHDGNDYNRDCSIEIEPGNYNSDQLFYEIERQLKEVSDNEYELYLNHVNNNVFITCVKLGVSKRTPFQDLINLFKKTSSNTVFSIDKEKSTILKILGFKLDQILENNAKYISKNPLKLIKRNTLDLNISFYNDDNLLFNIKDPICLKDKSSIYPINLEKVFSENNTISLNKIKLDFNGFNHREYPYYILLEITHKTI